MEVVRGIDLHQGDEVHSLHTVRSGVVRMKRGAISVVAWDTETDGETREDEWTLRDLHPHAKVWRFVRE